MLNRIKKWKPYQISRNSACLGPLTISIFTKSSVSAAKVEEEPVIVASTVPFAADPVREVLSGLRNFGLTNFLGGNYFRSVISTLNQLHVDRIIDCLRRENSDAALFFFHALRNEYGFRHSKDSQFVVAHVLASKRRFRDLQLVIRQMLDEEGMTFIVSFRNRIFVFWMTYESRSWLR